MIRIWDWSSGTEIATYPALGNLLCCEFSPVEDLIAAGDEGENLYMLTLHQIHAGAAYHEKEIG